MNTILNKIEATTGVDINKDGQIGGLSERKDKDFRIGNIADDAEDEPVIELNRDGIIGRQTIPADFSDKAEANTQTNVNNSEHSGDKDASEK